MSDAVSTSSLNNENTENVNFGESWRSDSKDHTDSRTLEDSFLRHDSVLDSVRFSDGQNSYNVLRDERSSILLLKRQLEQIQHIRKECVKKDQTLFEARNIIRELRSQCKLLQAKIDLQESELQRSQRAVQNEQRGALERKELALQLSTAQERNISQQERIHDLEFKLGVALKEAQIASDSALAKDKELVLASERHAEEMQQVRNKVREHESRMEGLDVRRVDTVAQVEAVRRTSNTLQQQVSDLEDNNTSLLTELAEKTNQIGVKEARIVELEKNLVEFVHCQSTVEEQCKVLSEKESELASLKVKLEQESACKVLADEELLVFKKRLNDQRTKTEQLVEELSTMEEMKVRLQEELSQSEERTDIVVQEAIEPLLKRLQKWQLFSQTAHELVSQLSSYTQKFIASKASGCDSLAAFPTQLSDDSLTEDSEIDMVLIGLESFRKSQVEVMETLKMEWQKQQAMKEELDAAKSDMSEIIGEVNKCVIKEKELHGIIEQRENFINEMQNELDQHREFNVTLEKEIAETKSNGELMLHSLESQVKQLFENVEQLPCGCNIAGFVAQHSNTASTPALSAVHQTTENPDQRDAQNSAPDVGKVCYQGDVIKNCTYAVQLLWEEVHACHAKQHLGEQRVHELTKELENNETRIRQVEELITRQAEEVIDREISFAAASKQRLQESLEQKLAEADRICQSKIRAAQFGAERAQADMQHAQLRCKSALRLCALLCEGSAAIVERGKALGIQKRVLNNLSGTYLKSQLELSALVKRLKTRENTGTYRIGNVRESRETAQPSDRARISFRSVVIAVIATKRICRTALAARDSDAFGMPFSNERVPKSSEIVVHFERLLSKDASEFTRANGLAESLMKAVKDGMFPGTRVARNQLFWYTLEQLGIQNPFQPPRTLRESLWYPRTNGLTRPNQIKTHPDVEFVESLIGALGSKLQELHQSGKSLAIALRKRTEEVKVFEQRAIESEDGLSCTNQVIAHLENQLHEVQLAAARLVPEQDYLELKNQCETMKFTIERLQEKEENAHTGLQDYQTKMKQYKSRCIELENETSSLKQKTTQLEQDSRSKARELSLLKAYAKQKEDESMAIKQRLSEMNDTQQTLRLSLREAQHNTNILLRSSASSMIKPETTD